MTQLISWHEHRKIIRPLRTRLNNYYCKFVDSQEIIPESDEDSDSHDLDINSNDVEDLFGNSPQDWSPDSDNMDNNSSGEELSIIYPPTANPSISTSEDNASGTSVQRSSQKQPRRKGGRLMDPVWDEFEKLNLDTWECKGCGWSVKKPKADRLRGHLNKCGTKRRKFNVSVSAPATSAVSVPGTADSTSKTCSSQSTLLEHFISTSNRQQQEIDKKLEKAICSSNIPFRVVENRYFMEWVKVLRPTYKLPTAKVVSTRLLDDLHQECENEIALKIRGKNATIMQDGWSTNQKQAVIAHSICVNNKVYFIDTVVAGDEEKTADNCLKWLKNCINKAEIKFGVRIVACVTDNCPSMEAMRRKLVIEFPDTLTNGCNPHLLNLLGKKATDAELMEQVLKVQKFFRNHDFAAALLKSVNGHRPTLPTEVRWNSQIDCKRSYLYNHAKYLEISRMDTRVDAAIVSILEDSSIFHRVRRAVNIMEPISTILDKVKIIE